VLFKVVERKWWYGAFQLSGRPVRIA